MKILSEIGREGIAFVYVAELSGGRKIEFVESLQPPLPREEKWVLLISSLFGCPVGCAMCDAGGSYQGRLTKSEIFAQIDYLVKKRFPDLRIPSKKFKIQFARMGEPAFNPEVLEVLEELPFRYDAPGLLPSLSTVAPEGSDGFFEDLLRIRRRHYSRFQLQFSIHTTDLELRDQLVPIAKWDFQRIAAYGERFYQDGDRKITLNFALVQGAPVDARLLLEHFSPERFMIKITPLNPTHRALSSGLSTYIDPFCEGKDYPVVRNLREAGFDVLVSIGEVEENLIGSNCGQYVLYHLETGRNLNGGYEYWRKHTRI